MDAPSPNILSRAIWICSRVNEPFDDSSPYNSKSWTMLFAKASPSTGLKISIACRSSLADISGLLSKYDIISHGLYVAELLIAARVVKITYFSNKKREVLPHLSFSSDSSSASSWSSISPGSSWSSAMTSSSCKSI